MRRIFGIKRQEVRKRFREVYNLYNLYLSPDIKDDQTRKREMGVRNAYKHFRKHERKRTLGRLVIDLRTVLKLILKK